MAAAKRNWDLSKLPTDIRSLAEEAANKAGLPVNDWLKGVVRTQSAVEQEERTAERRRTLEARAKELAREMTILPGGGPAAAQPVPQPTKPDSASKVAVVGVSSGGGLASRLNPTVSIAGEATAPDPARPAADIERLNGALATVGRYVSVTGDGPIPVALSSMGPNGFQSAPESGDPEVLALKDWLRDRPSVPPLILRAADDDVETYEVVAGLAHWRAAEDIGLATLDAIIAPLDERETVKLILIGTLCDDRISPIEEAESYRWLLRQTTIGEDDLMDISGHSRQHIRDLLALLTLPEKVQELIEDGRLGVQQARALFDARFAEAIADAAARHGLTPEQTKELVRLTDAIEKTGQDISGAVQEGVDNILAAPGKKKAVEQKIRIRIKTPGDESTPPDRGTGQ